MIDQLQALWTEMPAGTKLIERRDNLPPSTLPAPVHPSHRKQRRRGSAGNETARRELTPAMAVRGRSSFMPAGRTVDAHPLDNPASGSGQTSANPVDCGIQDAAAGGAESVRPATGAVPPFMPGDS